MMSILVFFFNILIVELKSEIGSSFTDTFTFYNSSLWEQGDSKMHCDDICFMALPNHLTYNSPDISAV